LRIKDITTITEIMGQLLTQLQIEEFNDSTLKKLDIMGYIYLSSGSRTCTSRIHQSLSSFWNELFVHVCNDTLNKKALTVFVSTCLMAEQKKKTNWDVPRGRRLCQWSKSHGSDSAKLGLLN